jgi:hypothetical protein
MSVKILTNDFKAHLFSEINRMEGAIKTFNSLLRDLERIHPWNREAKSSGENARDACEKNLALYRGFIADQNKWSASSEIPHELCLVSRGSILPSQTGTELFGFKIKASKIKDDHFYLYKGMLFEVSGPYNGEEGNLLVQNYFAKRRAKVESLQSEGEPQLNRQRTVIPESVRHEVWRRDQGCCVECGSKERLEYDHLIPFSKGGSNTARNLRLLYETCNRRKSASI